MMHSSTASGAGPLTQCSPSSRTVVASPADLEGGDDVAEPL